MRFNNFMNEKNFTQMKDMIDKNKSSIMRNDVDNIDVNGNYINDPLYLYQPIRRSGNDIYFYSDVDHYSQLVLINLLNDIQSDIISKNALQILNGDCHDAIRIHICSYGGYLSAGFALYDFIKSMEVTTIGIVEGVAASAASLILLACDIRDMTENSVVLLHQLSGGVVGTFENMKDNMLNADRAMDKLRNIYLMETSYGVTKEMKDRFKKLAEDDNDDEMNEYFESTLPERETELNILLQHDIELQKRECEEYDIIDKTESKPEVFLTEEDKEEIHNYIQKIAKKRMNIDKKDSETKKSTNKKSKKNKKSTKNIEKKEKETNKDVK